MCPRYGIALNRSEESIKLCIRCRPSPTQIALIGHFRAFKAIKVYLGAVGVKMAHSRIFGCLMSFWGLIPSKKSILEAVFPGGCNMGVLRGA